MYANGYCWRMPTALITGGSLGIGAAFAAQLAAGGNDLVLVARGQAQLEAKAKELRAAHGVEVETIVADLADRAAVDQVAARLRDPDRPVDMLVNNAGFGLRSKLVTDDPAVQEHAMDVMCRAVLVLGGAAAVAMRARGHGAIVNVSSVAGFLTMGGYSAIKAWVVAYTEGLSVELRGSGVTATVLCPGFVKTEFHKRASIDMSKLPGFGWVDVDELARGCLRDVDRGRVVSIPTLRYRFATALLRHGPRAGVRRVSAAIMSARHQ